MSDIVLILIAAAIAFRSARPRYVALRSTPTSKILREQAVLIAAVTIWVAISMALADEVSDPTSIVRFVSVIGLGCLLGTVAAASVPGPNRLNQRLLDAARKGNTAEAVMAISDGASPFISEKDGSQRSLLTLAAQSGEKELVVHLLKCKAPVSQGAGAAAVYSGNAEILEILLDGADAPLNLSDLLYSAINASNEGLIDFLVNRGARFNSEHFVLAISTGDLSLAQRILDAARIDLARDGSDALAVALSKDRIDHVEWLLRKGARVDPKADGRLSPLALAVSRGDESLVRTFLEQGASPGTVNESGDPVLTSAIGRRHDRVAELLIEKGAPLEARDGSGHTAIRRAATNQSRFLEKLVAAGADINAPNSRGESMLEDWLLFDFLSVDVIDRIIALGGRQPPPGSAAAEALSRNRSKSQKG